MEIVQPVLSPPSLLWPILAAFWVAGVGVSLVKWANSLRRLHNTRTHSHAVSLADLDCASSDFFVSKIEAATVIFSKEIRTPGLAGLFRPAILLPADILSWTSREERVSIIRHEVAHIRRHDHIVNFFHPILKALLFYHPMMRYASNQLELQRELACDDRVLALGTEPKAYAESILKAVERSFLTDAVHQSARFAARKSLERRIEMILDTNRERQPLKGWRSLLLPVVLIGLTAGMLSAAAGGHSLIQVRGVAFGSLVSQRSEPRAT